MQTGIAVRDTDQKQGSTMNSNANRKEKKMSTTIRTVSVAMLVTLGLGLAAGAAEPPKPAAPTDLDKLVGQPVDLAPWAYAWRADRALFAPERQAALAQLQLRLHRLEEWQEQLGKPLSFHSNPPEASE